MYYALSILTGVLVAITIVQNGALNARYGLYLANVIIHMTGLMIITLVAHKNGKSFCLKKVYLPTIIWAASSVLPQSCSATWPFPVSAYRPF